MKKLMLIAAGTVLSIGLVAFATGDSNSSSTMNCEPATCVTSCDESSSCDPDECCMLCCPESCPGK